MSVEKGPDRSLSFWGSNVTEVVVDWDGDESLPQHQPSPVLTHEFAGALPRPLRVAVVGGGRADREPAYRGDGSRDGKHMSS